jgi:hypothetical protein
VQWSHHTEEEATWEREEELKAEFTCFFSDPSESRRRDSLQGGRFVTPCFSERRKILEIIYPINYIMFVEFMSLHKFYFVLMYAFRFLFCD